MRKTRGIIIVLIMGAALISCSTFKGDPGNPMDGLREQVAAAVLDEDRTRGMGGDIRRSRI